MWKLTRFGWNIIVGIYKRNTGTETLYDYMSPVHELVSTFSETWTLTNQEKQFYVSIYELPYRIENYYTNYLP